jgi:hypothetical protein
MVLIGCTGLPASEDPATDGTSGSQLELATDTAPGPSDASRPVTTERSSAAGIDDAAAISTLPAVCLDESPIEPAQIGTVNTILVPANTEAFDGSVGAVPRQGVPWRRRVKSCADGPTKSAGEFSTLGGLCLVVIAQ